jgi:hypothetical protein
MSIKLRRCFMRGPLLKAYLEYARGILRWRRRTNDWPLNWPMLAVSTFSYPLIGEGSEVLLHNHGII